ncbi:MAG: hypothetical protein R2707_17230 [Acidimicrobiales bacterium]
MRPVVLVVVGLVMGVLAVLGVAAVLLSDDANDAQPAPVELSFPAVEHDPEAAEDLVVAWNRWRTATFVSSGTWTRTLDGAGDPLTGDTYIAQEPPRRVVVRLGAVIESIDGSLVTCDNPSEPVIVPGCSEVNGGLTYDERLQAEMSLVLNYVIGDQRIYDVAVVDDCFRVELIPAALRSPWGRAAEFCFDEVSGALASSRVRRQSAVDEEITFSIRTDVDDDDFLSASSEGSPSGD